MPYIEIDGIGPVLFEHSKRAKRIIITVKRDGWVKVAIPGKSSIKEAETFTRSKIDWIRTHLAQIDQAEQEGTDKLKNIDLPAANDKLINRIEQLAAKHKFGFNRLAIRNQKTLWGSCSARNNINLNIKLSVLPEELMDYVILHELVHTRIKNHGPKFWEELAKYIENPKQQASKLRKHGTELT